MEPLLETVDVDIEETTELRFKIKVEGVEPAPARVRLVCEAGDMSYMFPGNPTGEEGVVSFTLPVLKDRLKEGTYPSKVEVLIENRYFAPVAFNVNLKKTVNVVAEAIQLVTRKAPSAIKVSAAPVVVAAPPAPKPELRPAIIEATKPKPSVAVPVPVAKPAPVEAKENKTVPTLRERYVHKQLPEPEQGVLSTLARKFARTKGSTK